MSMEREDRAGKAWWLLLVAAVAGLAGMSAGMKGRGAFDHTPNLFCLKGSPYGMTLAFAMRGPMDLYWHRGQVEDHGHLDEEEDEGSDPGLEPEGGQPGEIEREVFERMLRMRREAEEEEAEHAAEAASGHDEDLPPPKHLREALLRKFAGMAADFHTRTHHMGDTPLMRAWRLGEAEKRMKLSYDMDPSNLVCYGSYFFFLSESMARLEGGVGEKAVIERGQLRALDLALRTVHYCRSRTDEPQAMITGAAACHDAITILLIRKSDDTPLLSNLHQLFGELLNGYVTLRMAMEEDGGWEQYSPYRQKEMQDAFSFLRVSHRADREAIERRIAEKE